MRAVLPGAAEEDARGNEVANVSAPHPQVVALLERARLSPLPTMDQVPAFVARRMYRERCIAVSPPAPRTGPITLLLAPSAAGPVAIRAYRPAGAGQDEVLPALVYFHGGGWTIGDPDTHDVLCRQLANGARCAVFSVDYRLAPEAPFPAAVDDCFAATRYVFANEKVLKINARQLALGGDSAGGNLATVVALMARDAGAARPCCQLLIYPATDQRFGTASYLRNGEGFLLTGKLMEKFRDYYLPRPADYLDWRASPALAKSLAGLPPAYVMTCGFDPLLDEGRAYAERLKKEGVDTRYREYPDMVHGYILFGGAVDTANAAVEECAAVLRSAFAKVSA